MKILYVHTSTVTKDIYTALRNIGYEVEVYPEIQKNLFLNDEEIDSLMEYIKEHEITHMVSIHLIYNLALAAHKSKIKYAAIIWDAPYYKLFSPFGKLENCYYSVFDKVDYKRFSENGIPNVLYQPLSISEELALECKKIKKEFKKNNTYINEICFVGSLYDENLFDLFLKNMPQFLKDYFDSIFEEAAFKWDGINRLYGKTSKELLDYMKAYCPGFEFVNPFEIEDMQYFDSFFLVRKIANIERICILNMLAQEHNVTLYTESKETDCLQNVTIKKPIYHDKQAPVVFMGSKINLNIALKGIEGGTPQRVIDIAGAGGFVMTTYCEETTELFVEDKEIVTFKSPEELLDKVNYYLAHDNAREKIARAGWEKVVKNYTYEKKLKEMMDWVEGRS